MQPAVAITLVELGLSLCPASARRSMSRREWSCYEAAVGAAHGRGRSMTVSKTDRLPIRSSTDIVLIRQAVRKWSGELGFSLVDQTKMITAASELARNSLDYGGGGTVHFEMLQDGLKKRPSAHVRGPGSRHSGHRLALTDGYTSGKGMGLGLGGAKRLVNVFEISRESEKEPVSRSRGGNDHLGRPSRCGRRRTDQGRRSQAADCRHWPSSWDFDEIQQGKAASDCDRGRDQSPQARRRWRIVILGLRCTVRPAQPRRFWARFRAVAWPTSGRCLADGYSSAGSPGTGLGAIRRLADAFEIYSVTGMGQSLWARLRADPRLESIIVWHGPGSDRRLPRRRGSLWR